MIDFIKNGWNCGCGEFNPEIFEHCRACEVLRSHKPPVTEQFGLGDTKPPPLEFAHVWAKEITLPSGMFSPQKDKVAARALKLVTTGTIHLPDKAHRAAGWFIIGFPGDIQDVDQRYSQEMVIEGSPQVDGTPHSSPLEILIQPGDIVAASDFQCWPVDLFDAEGKQDRWRLITAVDVIIVIKPNTQAYREIIRKYAPFTTETDRDINS